MVKDHSDSKKTRCRHMGYSFSISSKGSFICIIPQTGYVATTTTTTTTTIKL